MGGLHSSELKKFLKILLIYLREKESTQKQGWGERAEGEGEADSSLSRELDVGLDPNLSQRQTLY